MPLFVFPQLFLSLFRYNRLLFKVDMLSILVFEEHGDRKIIFIPTSWKPSQVATLFPGILVVRNDETGK